MCFISRLFLLQDNFTFSFFFFFFLCKSWQMKNSKGWMCCSDQFKSLFRERKQHSKDTSVGDILHKAAKATKAMCYITHLRRQRVLVCSFHPQGPYVMDAWLPHVVQRCRLKCHTGNGRPSNTIKKKKNIPFTQVSSTLHITRTPQWHTVLSLRNTR